MKKKHVEEEAVNQHLIQIIFKNRFKILIIMGLFIAGAAGVTFLIPKKYIAYGVVYPTNSNSIKDIAENPDFGFEAQADRLIQLFESEKMRNAIIEKFDLITYYDLDTTNEGWHYDLSKNYTDDIHFSRTKYLSVAIEAKMKDPKLAADVVNALMNKIDSLRAELFRENLVRLEKEYERKIPAQEGLVDSLLGAIQLLEEEPGARIFAERRLKQIEQAEEDGSFQYGDMLIKEKLRNHPGFVLEKTIEAYYRELGILNTLKDDEKKTRDAIELPFPNVYKISEAEIDRKKVSPSLKTNVLLGGFLGLLSALAFVILTAQWKSLRKRLQ